MSVSKENINDVLNIFFDFRLESIHTCLPGKIVSYDDSKRLANVQPLISLKTTKEIDIEYPTIENVPLIFPSGSIFTLRWDVQKDDGCLIIFSETGIGNFINSDGNTQVSSEDSTRFSLTDAMCLPGLFSAQKASNLSKDIEMYVDKEGLIIIKNKKASIEFDGEDGSISISNEKGSIEIDGGDGTIEILNEKGSVSLGGSDGKLDVNGNLTVEV
jgi:hypothetical protein